MTREEKLQLLKTPISNLEIGIKYDGKTLYGFYEIQSSSDEWHKEVVIINSQEELNKLVNVCNKNNRMNLLGFIKKN